jgi:hypothetical protein
MNDMPDNPDRSSHFKGFAGLLYPDLARLFLTLDAYILEHRPIEEIDSIEDEIRTLLAQRAYDLANHVLYHTDIFTWEAYAQSPLELIENSPDLQNIPDMTELPKSQ